jgi:hypothetical protein
MPAVLAALWRFGCVVEARLDTFEAGFRINQELRRHHHALAGLQAALDLGLAAGLDADLTSTGRNGRPSSASITTVRLPVWMTASVGINSDFSAPRMSMNCICTNMPGTSVPPGLASSSGP